jgi:hypothetical protein
MQVYQEDYNLIPSKAPRMYAMTVSSNKRKAQLEEVFVVPKRLFQGDNELRIKQCSYASLLDQNPLFTLPSQGIRGYQLIDNTASKEWTNHLRQIMDNVTSCDICTELKSLTLCEEVYSDALSTNSPSASASASDSTIRKKVTRSQNITGYTSSSYSNPSSTMMVVQQYNSHNEMVNEEEQQHIEDTEMISVGNGGYPSFYQQQLQRNDKLEMQNMKMLEIVKVKEEKENALLQIVKVKEEKENVLLQMMKVKEEKESALCEMLKENQQQLKVMLDREYKQHQQQPTQNNNNNNNEEMEQLKRENQLLKQQKVESSKVKVLTTVGDVEKTSISSIIGNNNKNTKGKQRKIDVQTCAGLNISDDGLNGTVLQQLYAHERFRNRDFCCGSNIAFKNPFEIFSGIHVLYDGYYYLPHLVSLLNNRLCSEEENFMYNFPILLKRTSVINGVSSEPFGLNAYISYDKECHDNIEWNMKVIRLNMLIQTFLATMAKQTSPTNPSKNASFNFANYMRNERITKGNIHSYQSFCQENSLAYAVPYPAEALTGFFEMKKPKEVISNGIGSKKSCKICGGGCTFYIHLSKKGEPEMQDTYQEKVHFGKTCIYSPEGGNTSFFDNLDKRLETFNIFVEKHHILVDMAKRYPMMNFKENFIDHLFYFDGTPYGRAAGARTTKDRFMEIMHHLPELSQKVDEARRSKQVPGENSFHAETKLMRDRCMHFQGFKNLLFFHPMSEQAQAYNNYMLQNSAAVNDANNTENMNVNFENGEEQYDNPPYSPVGDANNTENMNVLFENGAEQYDDPPYSPTSPEMKTYSDFVQTDGFFTTST